MQQGMAMMQAMPHSGSMMGGAGMGTMSEKGTPATRRLNADDGERMDMMQ